MGVLFFTAKMFFAEISLILLELDVNMYSQVSTKNTRSVLKPLPYKLFYRVYIYYYIADSKSIELAVPECSVRVVM